MRTTWLLCLLALTPSLFGQIAESLQVTVVEVPVTVHDRAGNALRGLTKENFELTVDGKKVPVEYFETVDLTKVTGAQESLPAAAYRNFLLLFDVANSSPGTTARAQEAARQFVQTQLSDRDLAAVATFTTQNGANMITAFTRDKELLLGAITTLGKAEHFKAADPLLLSANFTEAQGVIATAPERGGIAGGRADALVEGREDARDVNTYAQAAHDNEARGRVRTQLQNFGSVARALDRLHGQKQIILLSEGFDARLIVGREDLSFKNTQRENDNVAQGEVWKVDEERFGSTRGAAEITQMTELFRRSDVRLHAIDIKGLRGQADASGSLAKSNEGLFLITRPTGGTVFRNDNNLVAQFGQLLKQQEVIYILGFRARDARPGAFHPLRVKLVGAKGEVAHRSGYYDEQPNKTNLEATIEYSELLQTRSAIRDVPLTLTVLPLPGDEEARVPVIVDAAGAQFLQDVEGPAATANIFVYAFDEKGKVRDSAQQRIALDLAKTADTVRATGVRFVGSLRLPPGKYSVKAMVRVDESERVGLTTTHVEIPKYGETAVLAPVALGPIGRWVTVISRAYGGEAAQLLTLGERPFIPLTRAEMSGAAADVALMVRGIETDNLKVTPTLVAADGTVKPVDVRLAGRTEPDEHGLATLLFQVQPQSIASGEYELRFAVGSTVVKLPLVVR